MCLSLLAVIIIITIISFLFLLHAPPGTAALIQHTAKRFIFRKGFHTSNVV